MNEAITWLLNLVSSVDPALRVTLAGIGMVLETSLFVGLLVPGDTIVLVASTAVETPVEYVSLVIAVILGALIGESLGFALGHYLGPRVRESRLGRRLRLDSLSEAQSFLEQRGGIAIFLSRFLPVLHSVVPFAAGMSGMRYRRFILWTFPACLIWAVAYVSVGAWAAQSYRDLSHELSWAGYLFVAIIAAFIGLVYLVKKALKRYESRLFDADDTMTGEQDTTPDDHSRGPTP